MKSLYRLFIRRIPIIFWYPCMYTSDSGHKVLNAPLGRNMSILHTRTHMCVYVCVCVWNYIYIYIYSSTYQLINVALYRWKSIDFR